MFLFLSFERISKCNHEELKTVLYQTVLNCIYYNPLLTFQLLSKSNTLSFFMESIFPVSQQFKSTHQKKLFVLSFSSIFQLPLDQLPIVTQKIKPIILSCSQFLSSLSSTSQEPSNPNDIKNIDDEDEELDDHSFEDDKDVNFKDNLSLARDVNLFFLFLFF